MNINIFRKRPACTERAFITRELSPETADTCPNPQSLFVWHGHNGKLLPIRLVCAGPQCRSLGFHMCTKALLYDQENGNVYEPFQLILHRNCNKPSIISTLTTSEAWSPWLIGWVVCPGDSRYHNCLTHLISISLLNIDRMSGALAAAIFIFASSLVACK